MSVNVSHSPEECEFATDEISPIQLVAAGKCDMPEISVKDKQFKELQFSQIGNGQASNMPAGNSK